LLDKADTADAARDHHRHFRNRSNIPGEFQKVGFPRQRPPVARVAVHGGGFVTAAGEFDQIDSEIIQHLDDVFRVTGIEAPSLEIGRVEFHRDSELWRHRASHGLDGFKQERGSVFERPAPAIVAQVGERRQELADQIAMSCMDLDTGKTRLLGDLRRFNEARDDLVEFLLGHRFGSREHFRVFAEIERHWGWRPRLLTHALHDLAACMGPVAPDHGRRRC
jgi:hypothetical protein